MTATTSVRIVVCKIQHALQVDIVNTVKNKEGQKKKLLLLINKEKEDEGGKRKTITRSTNINIVEYMFLFLM